MRAALAEVGGLRSSRCASRFVIASLRFARSCCSGTVAIAVAARMPMIATVIMSSISVKPRRPVFTSGHDSLRETREGRSRSSGPPEVARVAARTRSGRRAAAHGPTVFRRPGPPAGSGSYTPAPAQRCRTARRRAGRGARIRVDVAEVRRSYRCRRGRPARRACTTCPRRHGVLEEHLALGRPAELVELGEATARPGALRRGWQRRPGDCAAGRRRCRTRRSSLPRPCGSRRGWSSPRPSCCGAGTAGSSGWRWPPGSR